MKNPQSQGKQKDGLGLWRVVIMVGMILVVGPFIFTQVTCWILRSFGGCGDLILLLVPLVLLGLFTCCIGMIGFLTSSHSKK
jgi:amino acid transporter